MTTEKTAPSLSTSWQRALYLPLIILAWLILILIGGWLLTHVTKAVLTLLLSGIIAFAITPLVSLFARVMPRGLAIALAYLLGFVVVFGLGALLVITTATQVKSLSHDLPAYVQQARSLEPRLLPLLKPLGVTQATLDRSQKQAIVALQGIGTTAAKESLGFLTLILDTFISVILIFILSVYLTANGPKIAQGLRRQTPGTQRWRTSLLIAIVNQVVGGYIRGTLTLASLIGVLVGVGMFILHVPYALLLGVLAFFMEFIPLVGVLVSGAICVVIALFQSPLTALLVLGYYAVVHVIEGEVVGPRIMGKAVGIHPATAIVGLVAGTELFGLWGALFAAPLAGLVQAIGTAAWRELRGGDAQTVVRAVVDKQKQQGEDDAQEAEKKQSIDDDANAPRETS